ncbi:MAG TPA: diadenylate cyclase CdaA [Tepidisphaeraceae bacterium]|jgi:diadenylate cyclase|nr:diadenylate cyclase CdaA [Tepidisphaeraceae bacterium]
MPTDFLDFSSFFRALHTYGWWRVAIELLIIGAVVVWVARFLRGTRGARMLKGIAVILIGLYLIVRLLGSALQLDRIVFLYNQLVLVVSFVMVVVFQPELRRALMRLGETRLFRGFSQHVDEEVEALVECATFCSKRKIGALIAVERDVGLGGIAESGTRINADLSAPLLNTIFFPNTELHDLGVVVSQGRIAYAGVQFPLAESDELERELGSRHRAAVGLSQESDAAIIVVSEETGDISIAERGHLTRKLSPDQLREKLSELLGRSSGLVGGHVEEE